MSSTIFPKAIKAILLVLVIVVSPHLILHAGSGTGQYKSGELVCKMQPGYDIEIINTTYGTTTKGYVSQTRCYLLKTPDDQDSENLADLIRTHPGVEYCGANYFLNSPESLQKSQPFIDLEMTGDYLTQIAVSDFNLVEVHQISTGEDVKVAVIDGGVNFDHPEFISTTDIISVYDYIDNDSIAFDEPGGVSSGHGTFVAGIIKLIAPDCDIYVYRVLDTAGQGDGYIITEALLQAINDGCKVVNLSLGMLGRHEALDHALQYAKEMDVTVITSAGNDSTENEADFPFPGKKVTCLTVAALDSLNIKADFSNYGNKVDICAPGTKIYSPFVDSSYAWWDGTSFATPFVTGTAALLYSNNPQMTDENVVFAITHSAINIDSLNPGLKGKLGFGLINIAGALEIDIEQPCGDVDLEEGINVADITYLVNYIFKGGAAPDPIKPGDTDCNSEINVTDLINLVNYIIKGSDNPCLECK